MHEKWMQLALAEAEKAYQKGEVPIGAVIVLEEQVIGSGHNLVETLQDPTAHAEMIAISKAVNALASWRLNDARLYVSLEPCPMCFGAIHLARISQVIYAADDSRLGACGSKVDLTGLNAMTQPIVIKKGILADQSRSLIQQFFKELRKK